MGQSKVRKKAHKRFKSNRESLPLLPLKTYERWGPIKREALSTWPRRLLHVSSMTSLERSAGNVYGGYKEPTYHAISYTWGRFVDSNEKSIQVNNLSWTVPPIKDAHFSTEDFGAAIRLAGVGVDFVWVDIACIDQADPMNKMDEIGKQAAIFRRASKVFAWLAPWHSEDLEQSLWIIEAYCRSFYEPQHGGLTSYIMKSKSERPKSTVISLLGAIQGLVAQPWFTSLWTLQEAYLCKDAILVSRSSTVPVLGAVMDEELEIPITLNWLLVRCQQVFTTCMSMEDAPAKEVCQDLVDSGLLSLSSKNEWTLYSASTKRQASLQNDRIYGIMQIYSISLGQQPNFSALQDAFGFLMNSQNPVLAQLHMHDVPPVKGKSWRVSEHMDLPFIFMHVLTSQSKCRIFSSPRGIPLITGRSCNFAELLNVWRTAMDQGERYGRTPYQSHILLDARISRASKAIDLIRSPSRQSSGIFSREWANRVGFEELATNLSLSIDQYSVLLLGYTKIGEDWPLSYAVGLLAFQQLEATGKPWVRAGVCAWRDEPDSDPATVTVTSPEGDLEDRVSVPEDLWRSFSGRLG